MLGGFGEVMACRLRTALVVRLSATSTRTRSYSNERPDPPLYRTDRSIDFKLSGVDGDYRRALVAGVIPKPIKVVKKPKRMKQRGKRTIEYEKWRDTVAKPYLDKVYGHVCQWCGTGESLDVDHVQTRGAHPELKMVLTNVRYLCRTCHITRL